MEIIDEFLQESNNIEDERSEIAFDDAKLAWEYAYENRDKVTLSYILEIHRILMNRINPRIAGKIRDKDVWIGGQHKRFISRKIVEGELLVRVCFEMMVHMISTDDRKELRAKQVHIVFEDIHPFEDGNGRVGRILYNIQRLKLDLSIHVIHEGKEQIEYYNWFRKI